jgi:hypothetical protein
VLQFGSSRAEEGGSRWCGRRGGGADGSRRWEPTYHAKRPSGAAGFGGSEGDTKMGRATKWAESQGGCSINSFFLNLNRILDSKIKGLKYF